MHFPYRRLHQPEAGLRSRNSHFRPRLWLQLQTSKVFESRSCSQGRIWGARGPRPSLREALGHLCFWGPAQV